MGTEDPGFADPRAEGDAIVAARPAGDVVAAAATLADEAGFGPASRMTASTG